jgi:colicin import membrane protein
MSTLLLNPRQMYAPDPEQQPVAAGVLTVVVHVAFATVLVLNMSWQENIRPQASVKLWQALPTTSVKAQSPKKSPKKRRTPVTPAKPDFKPAPNQLREAITQANPGSTSPAIPPPPSPVINIAPAQAIVPLRADLAAPNRERVDKPVPDSVNTGSVEPPPTYTPTQIVDVSRPVEPEIAPSRADLATPIQERMDEPAHDSVKAETVEPPPTYTPTQIVDTSRPIEPEIAPSRADLATPIRERMDTPARDSVKPDTVEPPPAHAPTQIAAASQPVTSEITPPRADIAAPVRQRIEKTAPTSTNTESIEPLPAYAAKQIEQRPDRKPDVDVAALRRDRALALAEELREEEDSRLSETLDREQTERNEETKRRRQVREDKLARELQEISTAAQQRLTKLEAQQAQEVAAKGLADDYYARISAKIRQRVILPPDLRGNPEAIYEVSLLPGGEVTQVRLLQSSGVLTYDAAVERAIMAAQPLPVPEDPELFHAIFKNFFLRFRPKE